jgi:hypothetical protein
MQNTQPTEPPKPTTIVDARCVGHPPTRHAVPPAVLIQKAARAVVKSQSGAPSQQ